MKFRANSRWKAKKRKGCWANDQRKKAKMADSVDTPGPSNLNNDVNTVNTPVNTTIFHPVTNRSAEKTGKQLFVF